MSPTSSDNDSNTHIARPRPSPSWLHVLLLMQMVSIAVAARPAIRTETPQTRIIGGSPVEDAMEFPYFALLADSSCAGTLIHDDYVLTAAHCERIVHPFFKRVFFGSTQYQRGIFRTVRRFLAHPAYLPTFQDYDFALLKLSSSALVDETTGQPTGLQILAINRDADVPQPGDPLQAMGFGRTEPGGNDMSPTLQQVRIQYVDDDTCRSQYGPDQYFDRVMFCAGVPGGGKDTCQGDSGGPILDVVRGTLVGTVSYGVGCARDDYAGVNGRVSTVVDWIEGEICRGSDRPPDYCTNREDYRATLRDRESNTVHLKGNETLGRMTLAASLDTYPVEFGWSLTYRGTNASSGATEEELFLLLPATITEAGAYLEQSFDSMVPGQYDLQFGDNGLDGICCNFGNGNLILINDITGETIWQHNGQYNGYLQARIEVNDRGEISFLYQNDVFRTSWQLYALPNYPPTFDPEFPGPMPGDGDTRFDVNVKLFAFNVNFRFDAYPEESNYEIYHLPDTDLTDSEIDSVKSFGPDEWDLVYAMVGVDDGIHNHLLPKEMVQQNPGWYWLKLQDENADGICCSFRRGWVTVTGPIITTLQNGLVWANDGEYGSGVDVYFYINPDGYIAAVHWFIALDASIEHVTTEKKTTPPRHWHSGQP